PAVGTGHGLDQRAVHEGGWRPWRRPRTRQDLLANAALEEASGHADARRAAILTDLGFACLGASRHAGILLGDGIPGQFAEERGDAIDPELDIHTVGPDIHAFDEK